MIRYATIGTNFIVERFLKEANKCDALQYVATYSRSEEKAKQFANQYGASRIFTDIYELAASNEIDAVYLASPNALHFSQAITLMKSKKHILCEKSIASNSRELEIMRDTALENHVVLLEAMRTAFDPALELIEKSITKLGKVRNASFQYCQYSSRYDKYKMGVIENAFNPALSNGSLMDIGVYCVYPMVRLFGEPESIQSNSIFLENGVDGAGMAIADYGKMQVSMMYSKITDSCIPSEIQGELGSMLIDKIGNPNKIWIEHRNGSKECVLERDKSSNMIYEIQAWIDLIRRQDYDHRYWETTRTEVKIMDEIRNQCGIVFPADTNNL